jgi:hypothetical protein
MMAWKMKLASWMTCAAQSPFRICTLLFTTSRTCAPSEIT